MSSHYMVERSAGVLLHPTSLPTRKLDSAADWLNFMEDCGLSVWQLLPLGIPEGGVSPYLCESAFAANPGLLPEIPALPEQEHVEFDQFCESQSFWLPDFVLFQMLKQRFNGAPWFEWPDGYKYRDEQALLEVRRENAEDLRRRGWEQFAVYTEWQKIREMAASKGIALFGDMPIFVAHDSADVWAHRCCFLLDDTGMPTVVAGVPPDYFSETGQRWGNPHYDWDCMANSDFRWWKARFKAQFEWFDIVRIDHFRGLEAVWQIPIESETAVAGEWVEVPGAKLLESVEKELGYLPLVAEDLGIITPSVERLRRQFELPGMSILQFSFDYFDDNPNKPANIVPDRVVYTGTHDNDTTLGWYRSLGDGDRQRVNDVLNIKGEREVVPAMIEAAMLSKGVMAIIPMQDFLELGTEARMNTPGTVEGNWLWFFSWEHISASLPARIRQWVTNSNRINHMPSEV